MKMLYTPEAAFAFLKLEPEVVEVVEVDFERGSATVIIDVPAGALVNVLRRDGTSPIKKMWRVVARASLSPLSEA
jgi:hypothetical protein